MENKVIYNVYNEDMSCMHTHIENQRDIYLIWMTSDYAIVRMRETAYHYYRVPHKQ